MGSFLMACAVTGATITEGAEVVAFKMKREEQAGRGSVDMFNAAWFISDFPFHGTYNDYGNVLLSDGSEVDASEDDLMIMYKWAHDVLVETVAKSDQENDDSYEKMGPEYTNYRLQRIDDARKAIDSCIKFKTPEYDGLPDLSDLVAAIKQASDDEKFFLSEKLRLVISKRMAEMVGSGALVWGGEGHGTSDNFWKDKILSSDDPHEIHDKFLKEVLPVVCSTNFIYFRLMPSMYGSQESNAKEMITLYERGLEYFKYYVKDWDE